MARRRRDLPFRWLFILFGAFIVSCGFSHFMDAMTAHVPLYRLAGLVKAVTALVSWATVLALLPVIPKALALRSPEELEREIRARVGAEESLQRANAELEARVRERTAELEQMVASLRDEVQHRNRVEQMLLGSQEQLRLVTDNVPVLLVHCDAERRYKFVNRAYAEVIGSTPRDVVGKAIPEVVGERAYERIRRYVDAALAGNQVEFEVESPDGGGGARWLQSTYLPHRSDSGFVEGFLAVILDVTERKKADDLLRTIADTVPALISYLDAGGNYRLNNRAYEKWFGRPRSALAGRHARDVLGEAAWAVVGPKFEEALAGRTVRYEAQVPYEVGGARWIDATYTPHFDAGGVVDGVVALVSDITDRKGAESALRQSEARFHLVTDSIPQLAWTAHADGHIFWYNRRWYDYTGTTPEAMEGWGWQSVHDPEALPKVMERWIGSIATGEPFDMVFPLRGADGHFRPFLTQVVPLRSPEGRVLQWFGTNTDVTESTRADVALRESEEQFRQLADAMPQIVWTARPDGNLDYYNERWYEYTGLPRERGGDESWKPILHPDDVQKCLDGWYAAVHSGTPYEMEYRFKHCKTGDYRWHLGRALPVRDSAGRIVRWFGTCTDFHDKKRAEEELKDLNATLERRIADGTTAVEGERRMLDAVLDALPIAVVISDPDGQLLRLNRAHERVWGVAPLSGSTDEYGEWVGFWPETGERVKAHEWALSRSLLGGETCPGELVEIERFGLRDRRFIINSAAPVRGPDGAIVAGVVASMDVTAQKQAERALLVAKQAAEAANRAKSEFLANMSHEIRTPMNGILGMTDLALDTDLTAEQRECLDAVRGSAESLLTIVNDILDFSKIEAGKLELCPAPFLLREALGDLLKPLAMRADKKGLSMALRVEPGVPDAVVGDEGRLRQVLINLVGNAIKFTERGGVEVGVRAEADGPDGTTLHVSVSDSGIGIPADKLAAVFAPFEQADNSTTRRFGGTGLGLTISAQLAGMMAGGLRVESEPGRGSTFHFTARLGVPPPCREGVPAARSGRHAAVSPSALAQGGQRMASPVGPLRILLAEDNLVNQKVSGWMLERAGHRVRIAGNGREAVDAWSREDFDLVLMDVQMPDMDGLEAAASIRRREGASGRHTPIIALTAHAMKGDRERFLAAGMDGYVTKPIDQKALWEEVAACVPRGGSSRPSGGEEPAFDRADFLAKIGEDAGAILEILETFGAESGRLVDEVRAPIARGDAHGLGRAAHSLKGMLGVMSAGPACRAAGRLEAMGRAEDLAGVGPAFEELARELARLAQALAGFQGEMEARRPAGVFQAGAS